MYTNNPKLIMDIPILIQPSMRTFFLPNLFSNVPNRGENKNNAIE